MANKKAKGKRGKTRRKLKRKGPRLSVSSIMNRPAPNSKVVVNIDSSVHAGMPPERYQGMFGVVRSVKKDTAFVSVGRGKNEKTLVVHTSHLSIVGSESK